MNRHRFSLFILLAALLLLGAGCPCNPLVSDPLNEPFCALLATLTEAAFGEQPPFVPGPLASCPARLVCEEPDCLRVEENGGFEADRPHSDRNDPDKWYGDFHGQSLILPCNGDVSLEFIATAPSDASASASAQVYQVIDYNDVVPASRRATMRRLRAQAPFFVHQPEPSDDRQFGLRILAFSGDRFQGADPETIPRFTADYALLDSVDVTARYTGDGFDAWQALRAELWLPDDTDFVVVLLEAYEDVQNDLRRPEFGGHHMDRVEVTIDGGNTAPIAAPDDFSILEDQAGDLGVLINDDDHTSRLDLGSIAIVRPPEKGTATPDPGGSVVYTPNPGFLGTDTFTYTVADVEGLRSNEAEVTIEVIARVRFVARDNFNFDTQDRWTVRVRGNSIGDQTVRHETTGGNPGGFRAMTHSTDGVGSIFVTHIYTAQPYVPSEQGAIISLNYSEDRLSLNGLNVGSRAVIWQAGQAHVALLTTFGDETWSTEAVEGLTADNFAPVPDFSATGDTLWFGYERANTTTDPNSRQFREHGIDNWTVEVFSEGLGTVSARRLDAARQDR